MHLHYLDDFNGMGLVLLALSTSMIHQKDADVLLRPRHLESSGLLFDPVTVSPEVRPRRPPTLSTAAGLILVLPDLVPIRPCSKNSLTGFDLTSGSLLLVVFFPFCKETPEYLNVPEKTMESVELNQQ